MTRETGDTHLPLEAPVSGHGHCVPVCLELHQQFRISSRHIVHLHHVWSTHELLQLRHTQPSQLLHLPLAHLRLLVVPLVLQHKSLSGSRRKKISEGPINSHNTFDNLITTAICSEGRLTPAIHLKGYFIPSSDKGLFSSRKIF